jgi:hypothetical protein
MRRLVSDRRVLSLLGAAAAAVAIFAAGCGEKIVIPEPQGLFGVFAYYEDSTIVENDVQQLLAVQGNLFVLTSTGMTKRTRLYGEILATGGFADARAFCADDAESLVFVWDQGLSRVTWYSSRDLVPLDHADLPAVHTVVSMATCRAGIEQVSGASTFLYLSDPDSGVVHRYVYDPFTGLTSYGILCRANGEGARFVHVPGALARDREDSLLVCDRDSLRNWVIRFHAVPDVADTATNPAFEDPLRGRAALFHVPSCNPPAAADYVLGDAPGCSPTGWVGGPSAELGEFDDPSSLAVDGLGRIFVADRGNDRLQIFSATGAVELAYGRPEWTPAPASLTLFDVRIPARVNYAAYVYLAADGVVRRYISGEHYDHLHDEPPPPPK